MTEPTIPQHSAFEIKLPMFEGPLDLLLHLIKKHELDVLDLPISFVTERYLEYLQMMQQLDLDEASEYLVMAATLAHIKSKMLLPQTPTADAAEEQDEGYQEDPRAELIRRLLEYQKYKAAAEHLGSRPIAGRDVFLRGMPAPQIQGVAPLASIDMFKLLDAFGAILKRVQGKSTLEVTAERITIHERMTQLTDLLRELRSATFDELFETDRTRYEVVVTFLALLEMTKLRMTRIYQTDPAAPLHVQYALDDDSASAPPPFAPTADGGGTATDVDEDLMAAPDDLDDAFGEDAFGAELAETQQWAAVPDEDELDEALSSRSGAASSDVDSDVDAGHGDLEEADPSADAPDPDSQTDEWKP